MIESLEVLLVMRKPGNLRVTQQALSEQGVSCAGVASERDLMALLEAQLPRLALVDVSGFGPGAWRICKLLQERSLPFIVIFQPDETRSSSESMRFGPMSVLQKPVAKSALVQLVQSIVH